MLPDNHFQRLRVHRGMLRDEVRTQAYRQAIAAAIKPGDTVLDLGAGSGILSMFAAKAGAAKVYAVERTAIARVAKALLERNGLADRVTVIEEDFLATELPGKVDVIVSETMGGYGIDENMLPLLLAARDRYLKPGGAILPKSVTVWMAPTWDDRRDHELNYWRNKPYGLDLSLISELTAHEYFIGEQNITVETLLAPPQAIWAADLTTCASALAQTPLRAALRFVTDRPGKLVSFAAWFTAEMGVESLILTNAPDAPKTHWGQSIFPLDRSVAVDAGTEISLEFTSEPAGVGWRHATWTVQIGSASSESHDTRNAAW